MDIRAIRSRRAIMQAGLKLFIQNKESTLVDIAKDAQVGRATVYRQFDDKESLQEAIGLYCLDRFDDVNKHLEKQAQDSLDAIRLILQNTLPLYLEFTFLNKFESVLVHSKKFQFRMKKQDDELRSLISLALDQGRLNNSYSVEWIFCYFEGLIWAGYKAIQSGEYTSKQAAELAFGSFKNGVSIF
ncbi:TetR/AcrR family transcriptional regulator [Glaciecola sp. SC05]|uniref:TetR/AcrR family transcriptional regulator n=1 Tax=Glaciecola sp. SC05 TaxID=1987355 RepID=UPI003526FBFF